MLKFNRIRQRRPPGNGVSIRTSLFRNFILLIVLIMVSFAAVIMILQYSQLSVLSRRLVTEAMIELERELNKDFQPVIKNINISAYWGRSKQYNHLESKEMLKMFIPILKEYDPIIRIKSSDGKGNGFSLVKEGRDWITRRTYTESAENRVLISRWNDDLALLNKRWEASATDLRQEDWYRNIIDQEPYKIGWNEPYFFNDANELVVTASIKIDNGSGEIYVLAFDILLTKLQEIMQEMTISENGIVYVSTLDNRIIGLSGSILKRSGTNIRDLALHSFYQTDFEPIKELITEWDSKNRKRFHKVVYFSTANQRWVGTILMFPAEGIPIMRIGMLAPMSDVMHYDVARGATILVIFVFALLFAVFMTKRMAKRYILPVKQILDQSVRISQGDLRKGEAISCNIKELKQLADTHEAMRQALEDSRYKLENYSQTLAEEVKARTSELKKKSEELEELNRTLEERVQQEVQENLKKDQLMLRSARQAQMGEMLSMIAHQWRQPLSSISTITGNLMVFLELEQYNKEQFLELLGNINDHAQFLSRTINDFRNFFSPNKKQESVMMPDILEQTIHIIGRSLEYKNIELQRDYAFKAPIITYPNEITQVFLNVLKNAQDVLVEKKIKAPRILIRGYEANRMQVIEIQDNAGGIPEEHMDKIFDPYFSTKDEKTGTGLGLYMSKLIVEKHCKGKLTAKNQEDGACFVIGLPMLTEQET